MGFLGPFSSEHLPGVQRYTYWMICMVGGGLIGIVADDLLSAAHDRDLARVALVSVLDDAGGDPVRPDHRASPDGHVDRSGGSISQLLWQVWPILAWRSW